MTVSSAGLLNLNGTGVLTDGTLVNAGGINAFGEVNALHNVDATNTGTIEVRLRGADARQHDLRQRGRRVSVEGTLTLADATIDQDFNATAPPAR